MQGVTSLAIRVDPPEPANMSVINAGSSPAGELMTTPTEIKKMLKRKKKKDTELVVRSKDLLSSGSSLINLACSGQVTGGFLKGTYVFVVGDSASGKTFLCLTCLAEASINPQFNDYRFIYDNAENGAMMNLERFFGREAASRIEPPAYVDDQPYFSQSTQDFYYHVDDALEYGYPFIYILDSMDALTTEAEVSKFAEQKDAHRKGKESKGDYGVSKAKDNSTNLRKLIPKLRDTGSILIIISQTRDNIGFGFDPKTRGGGHALKFYAHLELWSSVRKTITKTIRKKPRQVGIICRVKVKKNRLTGRERTVDFPIYHSYGIDDLGGMIDYLVEEGHWKGTKSINAEEYGVNLPREKLIRYIEDEELEEDLQMLVGQVWEEVEAASSLKRKRRY